MQGEQALVGNAVTTPRHKATQTAQAEPQGGEGRHEIQGGQEWQLLAPDRPHHPNGSQNQTTVDDPCRTKVPKISPGFSK